jgi:hypothetical protein
VALLRRRLAVDERGGLAEAGGGDVGVGDRVPSTGT